MHENQISQQILHCAIEVHRTLGGPGLLVSVYEEALAWELTQSGLAAQRQVFLPIKYKNQNLNTRLCLDLIVANKVIVECKAVSKHSTLFDSQTLTYLRVSGLKLGIIVNFGLPTVKDGFHRIVNGL